MEESRHQQFQALIDLDARHDRLLEQLDDLDRRVADALRQWCGANPKSAPPQHREEPADCPSETAPTPMRSPQHVAHQDITT